METQLVQDTSDDTFLVQEKLMQNPLIEAIGRVSNHIVDFKKRARAFYFEVILSPHSCLECGGQLRMTGQSLCSCSCGNTFDPTLTFQMSSCCGTRLIKKTFHYVCSHCHRTIPSRFLFDEKLFDASYFREMMQESRRRSKQKKEEIRKFLAESRSGALPLMEEPCLESITGLIHDLNDFIETDSDIMCQLSFDTGSGFHMNDYRDHILSMLSWDSVHFSDITPRIEDCRRDRVWRFITLVFMQNDREVELTQDGRDLRVQRLHNEAYS